MTLEGEGGHAALCSCRIVMTPFLPAGRSRLLRDGSPCRRNRLTPSRAVECAKFSQARSTAFRDIDGSRRDVVLQGVQEAGRDVAERRGVNLKIEVLNADEPAYCDKSVVAALTESAQSCGVSYRAMVSRAYHDSLFLSRIAPTAMLFVPCRNGWSHRPDEYASIEDIATGSAVLASALAALSA